MCVHMVHSPSWFNPSFIGILWTITRSNTNPDGFYTTVVYTWPTCRSIPCNVSRLDLMQWSYSNVSSPIIQTIGLHTCTSTSQGILAFTPYRWNWITNVTSSGEKPYKWCMCCCSYVLCTWRNKQYVQCMVTTYIHMKHEIPLYYTLEISDIFMGTLLPFSYIFRVCGMC